MIHDNWRWQIFCNFCPKTFASRSSLSHHKQTQLWDQEIQLHKVWQVILKSYVVIWRPTHSISHSEEKPLKCTQCNFSCNDPSYLKRHIEEHTGQELHHCNQCEFEATHFSSLNRHKKTRLEERKHRCTVCEYSSIMTRNSTVHIKRKHTGEKPHDCIQCKYASIEYSDSQTHMKTHSGENLFRCN